MWARDWNQWINKNGPNGCWLWLGATDNNGYPKHGENYIVRCSFEEKYGPIPKGYDTHHKCEVIICVNPEHIEAIDKKQHGIISQKRMGKYASWYRKARESL